MWGSFASVNSPQIICLHMEVERRKPGLFLLQKISQFKTRKDWALIIFCKICSSSNVWFLYSGWLTGNIEQLSTLPYFSPLLLIVDPRLENHSLQIVTLPLPPFRFFPERNDVNCLKKVTFFQHDPEETKFSTVLK